MFKKAFLIAAAFLGLGFATNAQVVFVVDGKLPGYYTNYEVGYSYSFTSVTQTQTFTFPDGSVKEFKSNNVKSLMSPGAYMGWSFRLKQLGNTATKALGLNVGVQENMFMWSHTSKSYGHTDWSSSGESIDGFYDEETVGMSMQIGVPVSVDFKFGNDAGKYKNVRWGGSIGVGAMPQFCMSAGIPNFESESFTAGVVPFVKGDISLFAGICMKLRAQVGFATKLGDSKNSLFGGMGGGLMEGADVKHDFQVKAPIQATVSFVIMPFSWAWDEKGFWNTRIR